MDNSPIFRKKPVFAPIIEKKLVLSLKCTHIFEVYAICSFWHNNNIFELLCEPLHPKPRRVIGWSFYSGRCSVLAVHYMPGFGIEDAL